MCDWTQRRKLLPLLTSVELRIILKCAGGLFAKADELPRLKLKTRLRTGRKVREGTEIGSDGIAGCCQREIGWEPPGRSTLHGPRVMAD